MRCLQYSQLGFEGAAEGSLARCGEPAAGDAGAGAGAGAGAENSCVSTKGCITCVGILLFRVLVSFTKKEGAVNTSVTSTGAKISELVVPATQHTYPTNAANACVGATHPLCTKPTSMFEEKTGEERG